MLKKEVRARMPILIREVEIPADRFLPLRRAIHGTELAHRYAMEAFSAIMESAVIACDEAWTECAKLCGFESLQELHSKGYSIVFDNGMAKLQLLTQHSDLTALCKEPVCFTCKNQLMLLPGGPSAVECCGIKYEIIP